METIATVELFEQGYRALRDKVTGLNKRAKKHGLRPLVMTVEQVKAFFPAYNAGVGPQQNLYAVRIEGVAPRINGWQLAARVEFNPIGTIVRIAPGIEDDGTYAQYRTIGPICQHCEKTRARKDLFILADEQGNRKIVGRNCLADFLRTDNAESLAQYAGYADIIRSIDTSDLEREYTEHYGGNIATLDRYLPVVSMLMRKIGWISRTEAKDKGNSATADYAANYLFGKGARHDKWIADNSLYADSDDERVAVAALAWARNVEAGNEYLNTIRTIAHAGIVEIPGLDGYAASILIAHRKTIERARAQDEAKRTAKPKVWIGDVGKRERGLRVKCLGTHTFEGHYGVTTIVRLEAHTERTVAPIVWFASGERERDWQADQDYTIDCTIKSQEDNDYGKQTKVNRVKVIK